MVALITPIIVEKKLARLVLTLMWACALFCNIPNAVAQSESNQSNFTIQQALDIAKDAETQYGRMISEKKASSKRSEYDLENINKLRQVTFDTVFYRNELDLGQISAKYRDKAAKIGSERDLKLLDILSLNTQLQKNSKKNIRNFSDGYSQEIEFV